MRQPRRLAPALAALRAQVPLRTWSEWAGVPPGALQGDLVLHCGESTAGRYCATLVAVDVATSWTELQALVDLHHQRVTGAIQHLAQRLPFPLREWHSACYELLVKPVNSLDAGPVGRSDRVAVPG
jgi:hypothetical protein